MDTSSFDNKMAEMRAEEVKKAVGRPKGPQMTQFRAQVRDAHLAGIKAWFKKNYGIDQPDSYWESSGVAGSALPLPSTPVHHGDPAGIVIHGEGAVDELKRQLALVLEDNDKMSKEVAAMENRLQRVARLTDNEKLILWIRKYDELKARMDELDR